MPSNQPAKLPVPSSRPQRTCMGMMPLPSDRIDLPLTLLTAEPPPISLELAEDQQEASVPERVNETLPVVRDDPAKDPLPNTAPQPGPRVRLLESRPPDPDETREPDPQVTLHPGQRIRIIRRPEDSSPRLPRRIRVVVRRDERTS